MKFSLKQLILFVTFAAIVCGVMGYAYNRLRIAQEMAYQTQAIAQNERERSNHLAALYASLKNSIEGQHRDVDHSILHWNVESGGNDPGTIA